MPLSYTLHIPVTASTLAVHPLVYTMLPITSEAPSNPILTPSSSTPFGNNISSRFSTLPSLSATCKTGTHFHVTSRLRLHLLKNFHGPNSGHYFTKHGDLRLQECYQPDIGYMHRTGESFTHSLPVQKLDASLANHAMTPRSSSGRPMRPKGFKFDHFSRRWGSASRYAAVMLSHGIIVVSVRIQKKIQRGRTTYICVPETAN
jgi:hypothetical protein